MPKTKVSRNICGKSNCKQPCGIEDYFCEKHTYQRYHGVWFKDRQGVLVGTEDDQ